MDSEDDSAAQNKIMILSDVLSRSFIITTYRYTLAAALDDKNKWAWLLRDRQGNDVMLSNYDIDCILEKAIKEHMT